MVQALGEVQRRLKLASLRANINCSTRKRGVSHISNCALCYQICVESAWWTCATWLGWRVVTTRIWRLSPVDFFNPKACVATLEAGLTKLCSFLQMAAVRGHIVAAIADSTVCDAVHERGVQLVIFTRECREDLISYFCTQFWWQRDNTARRDQRTVVINCHIAALFTLFFRRLSRSSQNFGLLSVLLCGKFALSAFPVQKRRKIVRKDFKGRVTVLQPATTYCISDAEMDALNKELAQCLFAVNVLYRNISFRSFLESIHCVCKLFRSYQCPGRLL